MSKKAQINIIVKLVIALIVIGMLIFISYKYILGTGEKIGALSGCEAQNGVCKAKGACNVQTERDLGGGLCKDVATQTCCLKISATP